MIYWTLWLEIGDWWNELLILPTENLCDIFRYDILQQILPQDFIAGFWYVLNCIPQVGV